VIGSRTNTAARVSAMDQGSGSKSQSLSAMPTSNGSHIVGYLPAGVVVWGGIGILLDSWLGTSFLTPAGLVLGWVLGCYLTYIRVVRTPRSDSADAQTEVHAGMGREGKSL